MTSPDTTSSPWTLVETKGRLSPQQVAQRCVEIVAAEPDFTNSIFQDLGFWSGLRMTVWMILHPYSNTRLTARTCKRKLIKQIRNEFGLT